MIQLLDLIILMVGSYIITKMMIVIFQNDPNQSKIGMAINKLLAIATIMITIVCIILALLSLVGSFTSEIEQMLK